MLKKTITYTDFDGNDRTEDFYFNLTRAELAEMEWSTEGGMAQYIKRITDAQDIKALLDIFKSLICKSYGVKSLDGKRFVKNSEVLEEFKQTNAYSDLFMELATDEDAAAAFVNGIIPDDIDIEEAKKEFAANNISEMKTGNA